MRAFPDSRPTIEAISSEGEGGSYRLCQPPKKELSGKVTHQLYANRGNGQSNRLDLVIVDGRLVDAAFYSIEDGLRKFVDAETEEAITNIIGIMEDGFVEEFLQVAEACTVDPIWKKGEIIPGVGAKEYEFENLDWPAELLSAFWEEQARETSKVVSEERLEMTVSFLLEEEDGSETLVTVTLVEETIIIAGPVTADILSYLVFDESGA